MEDIRCDEVMCRLDRMRTEMRKLVPSRTIEDAKVASSVMHQMDHIERLVKYDERALKSYFHSAGLECNMFDPSITAIKDRRTRLQAMQKEVEGLKKQIMADDLEAMRKEIVAKVENWYYAMRENEDAHGFKNFCMSKGRADVATKSLLDLVGRYTALLNSSCASS